MTGKIPHEKRREEDGGGGAVKGPAPVGSATIPGETHAAICGKVFWEPTDNDGSPILVIGGAWSPVRGKLLTLFDEWQRNCLAMRCRSALVAQNLDQTSSL